MSSRLVSLKGYISRSWSVSWPITVMMSFEFVIGLTDVYVAGRIGKEVQASYGFVVQIYFVLIVIANALTVGTVSVVSRLFTSGDREALSEAIFSVIIAAAIGGTLLSAAGIIFTPGIIKLVNIPAELKPLIPPFVTLYALGLLFHYMLINCNGILRSCDRVKTSLRTMTLVCIMNVGFNLFLVFNTSMGFRGIAAATALSVFVGSMLTLRQVWRLMTPGRRFLWATVKKVIHIGWPIGLLQTLWQLGSMVLFLILSALPEHKVEILAALTTGLRIESAIFLPAVAFNMANAVIIGNLLGQKKRDEAFRGGMVTAAIGVVIVATLAVTIVLNARWIVAFLSSNEIVIEESVKYLYINMISEPVMAWGIILAGGLNGAGDTRGVLRNVALSLWLVRIPLCYLFVVVLGFGPVSVWWCMNLSQFVMASLMTRRYLQRRWLST
jgi:multidrug resistance protein, MATE family